MRQKIASHFQRSHPASPVTSSVGVATLLPEMRSIAALVEAADRCLYQAKRRGRNRVVSAADEGRAPETTNDPSP